MSHATRVVPKSPWLFSFNSRPNAAFRLLCFPYAGGDGLTIFKKWSEMLPRTIDVCAVQLPGRGTRIWEQPFSNIRSAAEVLGLSLRPYLDKPFAFFGHSLGAKICFEVARFLKTSNGSGPFHLFVSGSSAPRSLNANPLTYVLPEGQFLEALQKLNGTPPEVLRNHELMKLMLPVLRAEMEASERYVYIKGPPLTCPITVFGGLQDERVTREELRAWREETSCACSFHMIPGDHFFINQQPATLLQLLSAHLMDSFSSRQIIPQPAEHKML
jgi:medium-chain acyl-[acyl-carrier-protein] hydrolase